MPTVTQLLAEKTIAAQELFRARPYLDSAGLWTIGYGFRFLLDGTRVARFTPEMSEAQGAALLTRKVSALIDQIDTALKVPLTNNETAALADFAYNVGMPAFLGSSVCRCLKSGDYLDAANDLLLWDKATDPRTHQLIVLADLVRRRAMERTMFLSPDPIPKVSEAA